MIDVPAAAVRLTLAEARSLWRTDFQRREP
jgi:hypothetical protein